MSIPAGRGELRVSEPARLGAAWRALGNSAPGVFGPLNSQRGRDHSSGRRSWGSRARRGIGGAAVVAVAVAARRGPAWVNAIPVAAGWALDIGRTRRASTFWWIRLSPLREGLDGLLAATAEGL